MSGDDMWRCWCPHCTPPPPFQSAGTSMLRFGDVNRLNDEDVERIADRVVETLLEARRDRL